MIVIIDYGVGNIFSLKNAFDHCGVKTKLSKDIADIKAAKALVLPGVGAFGDAIRSLENTGLIPEIRAQVLAGKPLLGICLGMQLLYERSHEYGVNLGLGFIKGDVVDIKKAIVSDLKVPHMGWNQLEFLADDPILAGVEQFSDCYFVHSYYVKSSGSEYLATTDYEVTVPAIVKLGNIYGIQFHPEKSGKVGLQLLENFGKLVQ
ncbi:MAG: imidazole glycerol phosphate synthase subunit HisH [Culicoidibacterales bacterium]